MQDGSRSMLGSALIELVRTGSDTARATEELSEGLERSSSSNESGRVFTA